MRISPWPRSSDRSRIVAGSLTVILVAISVLISLRVFMGDHDVRTVPASSAGAFDPLAQFAQRLLDPTPRRATASPFGPSREDAAIQRFLRLGFPVYCGAGKHRVVALTFDDGPGAYSDELANLLRRAKAPATFFLVGGNVALHPDIPARDYELGVIGDHSWSHRRLTDLAPSQIRRQLGLTRVAIENVGGGQVALFRPPYGEWNGQVARIARRMGFLTVLWSVDSRDWQFRDQRKVRAILAANLRPGAIVLMHEHGRSTLPTVAWLLKRLRQQKLRPVTVPELLAIDPPSRDQLSADARGQACVRYAG